MEKMNLKKDPLQNETKLTSKLISMGSLSVTPVDKDKLLALKKTITSCKQLAIFCHDYPDPDAIISAILLKKIANHFKVPATVFYSGTISRSENIVMFKQLKIPFQKSEGKTFDRFDGLATVDCQVGMGNLTFPKERYPNISIDHHANVVPTKKAHLNICLTHMGAAATIVMHYYLSYRLPLTSPIANSYVYTLLSETKNFSRDVNKLDMDLYKMILQKCDLKKISAIQLAKKSEKFYHLLQKALKNYQLKDGIICVDLGAIGDLNYIHEITETLSQIEGVKISVAAGTKKDQGRICARSDHQSANIGKVMKRAMKSLKKDDSQADRGGHAKMSAGVFSSNSKKALDVFYNEVKKTESKKK